MTLIHRLICDLPGSIASLQQLTSTLTADLLD